MEKLLRIWLLVLLIGGASDLIAYTPVGDSRVVFWLDASDAGTLFQNTARTIPVTVDGQPVGAWMDKSQNGWHVTAGSGDVSRPTYKVGQQNGISSIRFDGNSDSLRTLSASLQGTSYTIFVVARRISHRPLEAILSMHDAGSVDWNSAASACIGYSDGTLLADARNNLLMSQTAHPGNNASFLYATRYDGAQNVAYVNGVAGASIASGGSFSAETITLGARGAALEYLNNYEYFEVLVFNSALGAADRQTVEGYLGSKYALPNTQWAPPPPPPPQPPLGPYTPTGDSRVVFWLDAADPNTLFQDAARTTAVTTNGQYVGAWEDKSQNEWHVTVTGSDTNRPVYKAKQQNGNPSVRFDGISDSLRTLSASLQGPAYTVFVVGRRVSTRPFETILSIHDQTSVDWNSSASFAVGYSDGSVLAEVRDNALKSMTTHPGNGVSFLYASKYDGTNNTAFVNGLPGTQVSSGGSFSAEGIVLGARGAPLDYFNNYEYFEILIYDFALSDAYRAAVEAYLGSKYALPGTPWEPPPPPPPPDPVGPYTPVGDSRVVFWLDAADPATLFQDPGMSVPVLANGHPIGAWADKSQNGWHVSVVGNDTNRPVYKAGQQNGVPAVRFDGPADALRTASASLQGSSYTVFVVCRQIAYRPFEGILSIHDAGALDWNSGSSACIGFSDGDLLADVRDSKVRSFVPHPGNGVSFLFATRYDGVANTSFINGAPGTTMSGGGNFDAEVILLGARGANLYPYNQYDYFEVLIYDFALSDGYRQAVEAYLGSKYALEGTPWAPPPPPPPVAPTGPYSPEGDPRLIFWLDAADTNTLFQDIAKTVPVTSNGHPVAVWQDKSQSGWHVSIAGGDTNNRPTFKANQLNGISSVRTVDSDWLRTTEAALRGSNYTFFVVGRRLSSTFQEVLLSIHDANSADWDNNKSIVFGHVHADGVMSDVRNDILLSQHMHPGDGYAFMLASTYDGLFNTAHMNGTGAGSITNSGKLSAEIITLGARNNYLYYYNNYDYFEVLIYDFAMDDDYRQAVEDYLGKKYAFPGTPWAPPPPPPPPPPEPPVGPYTPAGDPHVVFWLDVADTSTLFQDVGGTSPVTANGQLVGAWADKSQNGWHVTVEGGDDSNKPTLMLNQLNGLPSVRTTGTEDWLRTTTASLSGSSYTFFIVCRRQSATFQEVLLSIHDSSSTDWDNNISLAFGHVHADGMMSDVRTDVELSRHEHPGDGIGFLLATTYDGSFNKAYLNGVAGAPVPSSGSFSSEVITLGSRNNYLAYANNYDYFEVLIYDFAMSDAYRQAVEAYLAAKYGLP